MGPVAQSQPGGRATTVGQQQVSGEPADSAATPEPPDRSRLAGARVLIGRSPGRSGGLIGALAAAGASAQAVPLIQVQPPADSAELDAAVLALSSGDVEWVAFTSVNAVSAVVDRARSLAVQPTLAAGVRVAAVGPSTAAALRDAGLPVDLTPAGAASGVALGAAFPHPATGSRPLVLLPQSDIARPELAKALADKGFQVRGVPAYRTVSATLPATVAADLHAGAFDCVVVSSPSGLPALLAAAAPALLPAVVAIGESTAAALRDQRVPVAAVATAPTDGATVDAIAAALADKHVPDTDGR